MRPIIAGFLDQDGTSSFDEQIELVNKHKLSSICLRQYNQKPLIELKDSEIKKIMSTLKEQKLKIAIIDTNNKSYDIYNDRNHADMLDEFKYMVKLSDKLKVSHLFFRLPKFTNVIEEYDAIEKRLTPYVDIAMRHNKKIILLPVNHYKANIYAYILKKMKSNVLSVVFNPVSVMLNNEPTTTAYRLLKKKIGAFMTVDADHQGVPKLIGYGKTDIIPLFKKLLRDKYAGFLLIDNEFKQTVFKPEPIKQGFFQKIFSREKKKIENELNDLSKKIFPNEETKNVTHDDILENQIKVLKVIFK
ncbi:MAG: sugar phosphate isomerase/epimerase [Tenericutes bacterium]|nr:sugar phosphate isomerase/epimerase [Mycoplasmatota bacterium]